MNLATNFSANFVGADEDGDFVTIAEMAEQKMHFYFEGANPFNALDDEAKEIEVQRLIHQFQTSGNFLIKVVGYNDRVRYFPIQHLNDEFARYLLDQDEEAQLEDYGESGSFTQLLSILPTMDYFMFTELSEIGAPGRPRSRSRSNSQKRETKRSHSQSKSKAVTVPIPLLTLPIELPGSRAAQAEELRRVLPSLLPSTAKTMELGKKMGIIRRGMKRNKLVRKRLYQMASNLRRRAKREKEAYLEKKQRTEEKKDAIAEAARLRIQASQVRGLGVGLVNRKEADRLERRVKELTQQGYGKKRKANSTGRPKRPKRARQNDVAFFPYLLNPVASRWIDLDFAQIFRETNIQYETKHCLTSTLEYYQIDAGILSDIAQKYQNFALHVPRTCLKETAEHCKIRIALTTYRNDNDAGTAKTFFTPSAGVFTRTIEVGLYEDHLFPNVTTKYTSFFIHHLEKLSDMVDNKRLSPEDIYRAVKLDSVKDKLKFSPPQKPMSTIAVVRALSKGGFFDKVSPACLIQTKDEEKLTEENVTNNQRMWEFERNRKRAKKEEEEEELEEDSEEAEEVDAEILDKGDYIFFAADFESYVQGQHSACMAGCMELDLDRDLVTDPAKVRLFDGDTMIADLFSFVINTTRQREIARGRSFTKKVVFFHNLKYDATLFESDPNIQIKSTCEKGGSLYSINIRFSGTFISIRDSLKMINVGISKFSTAFQLPTELKKQDEFIIYEFFDEDNSSTDFYCTLEEYVGDHQFDGNAEKNLTKRTKFIADLKTFLQSKHWLNSETRFSPWSLYQFYLRYDVLVLAAGLHRFNENFKVITNDKLQVLHSLTISSFANRYMGFHGCFKDAYEMSLSTRSFQAKAVYGGRVFCTPEFEGRENRGEFDYFDACSLYPTAIKFICDERGGFPSGPCQLLRPEELNYGFLQAETTEYTVEIRITAVNKKQHSVPFIAHRKKNKSIDYLNALPNGPIEVTVDRQTLEDYLEFHQIEFEVLRGIYWSGSKNTQWGAVIENLYQERLKCKAAGFGVRSDNLKLIMNSAYGKTIMRTTPTEKVFIPIQRTCKGKKIDNPWRLTIFNQLQITKSFRFVGSHQIELTRFRKDISHTLSKYGSMILAASKHIMNRVFNLMSDMKQPIYYTDTDSFVVDRSSRLLLADAFRVRYGKELVGDQLGQMHSDFSFKHEGKSVSPELVHSTHFFPMAKKLYLHCLVATMPDGQAHHSIQFKSKGCTQVGLLYKSREYDEGDEGVVGLFRALSQGETVEVPLNPPGNVRFVYDKDNRVTTDRDKIFYRNIKSEAAQLRLIPTPETEGDFEIEDLVD